MKEFTEFLEEPKLSKVEKIAVNWVTRSDSGLTDEESNELQEWLDESPEHREAFEELKWNWDELDRLAGFHVGCSSNEDPDLLTRKRFHPLDYFVSSHWRKLIPVAAIVILSLSALLTFDFQDEQVPNTSNDVVVVERIQSLDLEDGSRIQLNHGAEVDVRYSATERLVTLLHGEANFIVAKDHDRPFVVEVSGVRLRAVGTAFNVRFGEAKLDVIVSEGTVAIATLVDDELANDEVKEALLEVNHRAIVDLDAKVPVPEIERIDARSMQKELIWQPVYFDFDTVPLSEIIAEFNRRNRTQMVVVDASINSMKMSSMFWSDNVNGFIRLLETNFGIRVELGEDGTIYLFNS